ncbi:MAG TPA: hypothetical protein VNZ03_06255 [Terriglobales bacterium]|nr:hypothetical protein [Terriglobales bacterium]
MRIPTDATERADLLNKLREAVAFQIGLWDAAASISESLKCDRKDVLDYLSGRAIVADDGMELSHDDLDDLLGVGIPGRAIVGKPLSPAKRQSH